LHSIACPSAQRGALDVKSCTTPPVAGGPVVSAQLANIKVGCHQTPGAHCMLCGMLINVPHVKGMLTFM